MNNKELFKTKENEYEPVKLLKKSERSSVFVARRKSDGKRFLLRVIEEKTDIFEKIKGVSCKNLPEIIDVEKDENRTLIVEEYVPGDNLFEILKGGVIPEKEAAKIIVQICKGLSVLHEHGIIHRDVKPENILLFGEKTVLIDFDASRKIDPEKETDTKILGTTGYAPPEQYGLSQTDARSDIYSAGVVLNVMLTGEHPSTKLAPGALGKIVQKCTMIDPESRFQNAEELIKAIRKAEKPKRTAKIFVFAAVLFVLAATLLMKIPKEEPFEEPENNAEKEKPTEQYLEIENSGTAEGKSLVLPPDFYDYWSAEEILTENIKLSVNGNLENYINYKFSDDVLTFTIGNVPEEEWEKALSEIPEGEEMIFASIILEAPSENVCKIATHYGNGPTYSNLKKQEQSGDEIEYDDFNALMDYDWTLQEIATIVYEDGKKIVAPVEANSIFYKVIYWETYDGEIIRQILPYEIVIGEDCFAYSFEDENFVENEPPEYDTKWLDYYWNPVENPERVVFKTIFGGRKETEISVFSENGLSVEIFEKPGFINVSVENPEKLNPEFVANSEILILPPDSRPREDGESLEKWLESVYSETKYAGCKINAGGIGSSENPEETADFNQRIVDGGYFYDVRNRTICVSNLFPMNSAKTKDGTLWYTINYGQATFLIMDWYLENPEENPGAKPETKEYIYHDYESFTVLQKE